MTEEKILLVLEMENRIFEEMPKEEKNQLLTLMEKYVGMVRKKSSQLI